MPDRSPKGRAESEKEVMSQTEKWYCPCHPLYREYSCRAGDRCDYCGSRQTEMTDLAPQQCDPLAYETQSLMAEIQRLAKANQTLSLENPREWEELWMNLAKIDSLEAEVLKIQRSRDSETPPIRRGCLTLVWSQK